MYFKECEKLLIPPIARAAYSDRTAWLMAEMSKFAYIKFETDNAKLEKLRNEIKEANFELVDTFNSRASGGTLSGTQAFLAMRNEPNKMAVLAFRGTEMEPLTLETLKDLITDLDARFYKDENGVKIHKGFNRAFNAVKNEITESLKKIGDTPLYITGHSLGGALALVATQAFNSDNIAACYTFGSPKVGNDEFDDMIKVPIYRVVNHVDLVPFLPFTPILHILRIFKKARPLIKLVDYLKHYQHHGDRRLLENNLTPDEKIRLKQNYVEISRSFRLIWGMFTNIDIGVECHSLEEYCTKLGRYALQRL